MPRGGKRPGAGRKAGSQSKRTKARRELAGKAAAQGITPLEVMLDAMRRLHKAKEYGAAAAVAKDAAPYVHPRLSAVTLKGDKDEPITVVEKLVIVDGDSTPGAPAAPGPDGVPSK